MPSVEPHEITDGQTTTIGLYTG